MFESILKLKGFPLADATRRLKEISGYTELEFSHYQNEARWSIFEFHRNNNEWYKQLIGNIKIENWQSIPVIKKSDLQVPIAKILSNGYDVKNVFVNNTSGSTGIPLFFAKDKFCHAMTWAYILEAYQNIGIDYGKSKQARFYGIPKTPIKYYKEFLKDYFSNRVRFPVFDLSDAKLELFLKTFSKSKFEYLYGYTSSLVLFAMFLNFKGILLRDVCKTLRCCIVTSEVCSNGDKSILEQNFGVKVVNEYGAAELDIIAFSDQDGDWLLNDKNLFIEIVDEAGVPVEDGQPGSVVVTSLYNKAMPFIRYSLGDILKLSKEKKGNSRIVESMEGRVNDVALLPSGKKSPGLTFYYVSKSLMNENGVLKEFTIKQLALDHFHFDYVAHDDLSPSQQIKVKKMVEKYLEPGLQVTFERVNQIQRIGAGKFRHFQSLVNNR
jgi:phenylacetate-CoA ligase